MASATVQPSLRIAGSVRVPGDKSISHRYAIVAALADGGSTIEGFAPGADCAATLDCLRQLGVAVIDADERGRRIVHVAGRGLRALTPSPSPLDARNSGTTLRLLAGVLAAHAFESVLTGDASLRRRPMRRVMEPLTRMGARLIATDDRAPLTIVGGHLRGIAYTLPVASAQVKSAVLLAGLQAEGRTEVAEPAATRDHTERALEAFGARVDRRGSGGAGKTIGLDGGQRLEARDLLVPGDLSSAAFWAVAATALPGSEVELVDVGLNATRAHLLDVLRRAGAQIDVEVHHDAGGEPLGRVRVRHRAVARLEIAPREVPSLIDELPALAALATYGGEIVVTGASELRAKESDRISALVAGLRALGGDADELPDGFHVRGTRRLAGGVVDPLGDHRLAMAFAIAALGATGPTTILGAECVEVSYPGFFEVLERLAY